MADIAKVVADLSGSAEQQVETLERLRRLAKLSDENRVEIARVGGIDKVRQILQGKSEDRVRERCVILLVYLAKSEENRDVIRETGALEQLLKELKSPVSTILHNAMAALVNATIANTENQNFVREQGALVTIVEMLQNRGNVKTRQNACWLLKKLVTHNQRNRDALRELGVLRALVPLLDRDENVEVQEHAVALLAFMLEQHARNCSTFKDTAGGPNALKMLADRNANSGTKLEEYANLCIEYMGGVKKLMDTDSKGSSERLAPPPSTSSTHSGTSSSKSPRMAPSPRPTKDKDSSKPVTPRSEKKTPRLFGRKKEQEQPSKPTHIWVQGSEEDPIMKGGGGRRRSMDAEEIDSSF